MRLLKFLLVALLAVAAVTVGLVAVVALAVGLMAYVLGRRLLRRFQGAGATPVNLPHPAPRVSPAHGEVIEVTATEVPTDRELPR
jgi:hypothetical protein